MELSFRLLIFLGFVNFLVVAKKSDVVTLTDSSFDRKISSSDDSEVWLVAFVAPWCGYCKKLEPEFDNAASTLAGTGAILARVDATVEEKLQKRFQVSGYPTLKTFKGGNPSNPLDYNGPREADDIVTHMSNMAGPPPVKEVTSQSSFDSKCDVEGRVCVVAFLPHILDSGAAAREAYIAELRSVAKRLFGARVTVFWSEGGSQPALEGAAGVAATAYPTAAVYSAAKGLAAPFRGSWDVRKLEKFASPATPYPGLGPFEGGKGRLEVVELEGWDGKDGVLPEEEFSLEDLMGDDEF